MVGVKCSVQCGVSADIIILIHTLWWCHRSDQWWQKDKDYWHNQDWTKMLPIYRAIPSHSSLFIILLFNISYPSSAWRPVWFIQSKPWSRHCVAWTEQAWGIFPNRIDLHPSTPLSMCVCVVERCVCVCVCWLSSCIRQQKHVSVLTQGMKRHTNAVPLTDAVECINMGSIWRQIYQRDLGASCLISAVSGDEVKLDHNALLHILKQNLWEHKSTVIMGGLQMVTGLLTKLSSGAVNNTGWC